MIVFQSDLLEIQLFPVIWGKLFPAVKTTGVTPASLMGESKIIISEVMHHDILKHLPTKSLVRFDSVCKSFYRLFRTPSFIKENLEIMKRSRGGGVLISWFFIDIIWRVMMILDLG